jgi:hypothetical protein
MCPDLLSDTRLYALLLKFDQDLFAQTRAQGCPCGGVLHSASYGRKPRGAQTALPEEYARRHSLCCDQDGCRKRRTPPSLRFLGRKVYLGAVVVVVTAMRHGVTAARGASLSAAVGASRETLERWRRWWTEAFAATAFWQRASGMLHAPVAEGELPASLLARLDAPDEHWRVVRFLDFIKPVTTAAVGNWSSISLVN